MSIFLLLSILISLVVKPHLNLRNMVVLALMSVGGFTYYSVVPNPSNKYLIGAIGSLILEVYLFSVYYLSLVFRQTSDFGLVGMPLLIATVVLAILLNLFRIEYRKSTASMEAPV